MGLPTPNTRKEQFLNAIATGNSDGLPTPITREEEYLNAIANSGGGGGEGDMKKSVYDSDLDVAGAGGIKAFVNDALAGKQDKTDNNLQTADKTILGAINEVNSGLNKSWSLDGGISIANNTDLNDITTVGNYYATTAASATLSHCPITGAFKLKVLYDVRETAPAYIEQVFNPMSSYDEYRRYKSGSAAWSDWHLTNCNLDEERDKVADNAEAIEAMVNVYGCCNILPNDMQSGSQQDVIYTVNSDYTISLAGTALITIDRNVTERAKLKAGSYKVSGCPVGGGESTYLLMVYNDVTHQYIAFDSGSGASFTLASDSTILVTLRVYGGANVDGKVFKPMIHDARLNPTGYVPYAMTNRELTADVKWIKDKTFVPIPSGGSFSYSVNDNGYFVAINRQDEAGAIYYTSNNAVTRIAGSNMVDGMISISNGVVTITNNVSWPIHASIF